MEGGEGTRPTKPANEKQGISSGLYDTQIVGQDRETDAERQRAKASLVTADERSKSEIKEAAAEWVDKSPALIISSLERKLRSLKSDISNLEAAGRTGELNEKRNEIMRLEVEVGEAKLAKIRDDRAKLMESLTALEEAEKIQVDLLEDSRQRLPIQGDDFNEKNAA